MDSERKEWIVNKKYEPAYNLGLINWNGYYGNFNFPTGITLEKFNELHPNWKESIEEDKKENEENKIIRITIPNGKRIRDSHGVLYTSSNVNSCCREFIYIK